MTQAKRCMNYTEESVKTSAMTNVT